MSTVFSFKQTIPKQSDSLSKHARHAKSANAE
jgi:hypothetical protein